MVITEVELLGTDAVVLFEVDLDARGVVDETVLADAVVEFCEVNQLACIPGEFVSVFLEHMRASQMRATATIDTARESGQVPVTARPTHMTLSNVALASPLGPLDVVFLYDHAAPNGTDNTALCGGVQVGCSPWDARNQSDVARLALLNSLERLEVKFRLQLDQIQTDIQEVTALLDTRRDDRLGTVLEADDDSHSHSHSADNTATSTPTSFPAAVTSPFLTVPANATELDSRGRPCVPPSLPLPDNNHCIILFWTKYYWGDVQSEFVDLMTNFNCDRSCVWTNDRRALADASALVFHDWEPADLPPYRMCGQKWVKLMRESPSSRPVGFMAIPRSFLIDQYDAVSTYRLDSDIPYPYFPYEGQAEEWGLFEEHVKWEDRRSDALIAWVARNCQDAANGRTDSVLELMTYMRVHNYGRCLHNIDFPKDGEFMRKDYMHSDMDNLLSSYKFVIVYENSNCVDYVTEKLWRAFRMGVVPVYIGAPNIAEFEPLPSSVVRASDFRTAKELAGYLQWLGSNETEYNHFLRFKHTKEVSDKFYHNWMIPRWPWQCRVCDFVGNNRPRTFWEDRSCAYTWGHY